MFPSFNTDVKVESTVYHVQSEARQSEMLFQTQVFESGRVVGKRARSYANLAVAANYAEAAVQEKFRELHRQVVQAAREGRIEEFLAADTTIQDVDGDGLGLNWLNPEVTRETLPDPVTLRIAVEDRGRPLEGALLVCRADASETAPVHAHARSGRDGVAELQLSSRAVPFATPEKFVIVRAEIGLRSATRKFRLQRG